MVALLDAVLLDVVGDSVPTRTGDDLGVTKTEEEGEDCSVMLRLLDGLATSMGIS